MIPGNGYEGHAAVLRSPAIRIRNLGKKYQVGGPQEKYLTLRDAVVNSLKAPFKRFHRAPPNEEFLSARKICSHMMGRWCCL